MPPVSMDPRETHCEDQTDRIPTEPLPWTGRGFSPEFHEQDSFPDPFDSDSTYRRRLILSIVASLLFNILFLWLIFASHFSEIAWFRPKPRPKASKEIPQLVLIQKPEPPKPQARTFLETDADQAVQEPPKDAAFYSEHNTAATQTTPSEIKPGDLPKADGKNTKTMATETVLPTKPSPPSPQTPQVKPSPSQPPQPEPPQKTAPASEKPAAPPSPQPTPKPAPELPKIGDYALLKTPPLQVKPAPEKDPFKESPETVPQTSPRPPPTPPAASRDPTPPTAPSQPSPPSPNREVLAAMSKLGGGVNRTGKALAFNSAESPFAAYDKKVIGKIGAYWQYLVANRFYGETVGEVEITFKLMSDGRITQLQVSRNSANVVLAGWCIQAIQESSPFSPFPESMIAIVGDSREGSITFAF